MEEHFFFLSILRQIVLCLILKCMYYILCDVFMCVPMCMHAHASTILSILSYSSAANSIHLLWLAFDIFL